MSIHDTPAQVHAENVKKNRNLQRKLHYGNCNMPDLSIGNKPLDNKTYENLAHMKALGASVEKMMPLLKTTNPVDVYDVMNIKEVNARVEFIKQQLADNNDLDLYVILHEVQTIARKAPKVIHRLKAYDMLLKHLDKRNDTTTNTTNIINGGNFSIASLLSPTAIISEERRKLIAEMDNDTVDAEAIEMQIEEEVKEEENFDPEAEKKKLVEKQKLEEEIRARVKEKNRLEWEKKRKEMELIEKAKKETEEDIKKANESLIEEEGF